jgi:nicotinate-nucleotide adenylyltransferase
MISGTRIGILGGTFDPVHTGHVDTALAAQRALMLDAVLLLPSGTPPHRTQPQASRFHRFAMAALAVTGVQGLMVSDLEIGATEPSYTFDTLARLHAAGLSASRLFFITGADAFAEIETWSRYPQVLDMAQFVVVSRPGYPAARLRTTLPELAPRMQTRDPQAATVVDSAAPAVTLVDAPTRDVSSTEVRRNLESGASIAGLVPAAVETYIAQHGLYSRVEARVTPGKSLA